MGLIPVPNPTYGMKFASPPQRQPIFFNSNTQSALWNPHTETASIPIEHAAAAALASHRKQVSSRSLSSSASMPSLQAFNQLNQIKNAYDGNFNPYDTQSMQPMYPIAEPGRPIYDHYPLVPGQGIQYATHIFPTPPSMSKSQFTQAFSSFRPAGASLSSSHSSAALHAGSIRKPHPPQ
jgi:hypothetical protein